VPSLVEAALPLVCFLIALAGPHVVAAADEGEKVYEESCSPCHNAKSHSHEAVHLSRKEWKDAIERMEGMGTEVPSGKKLSALLDYLERTHGVDDGPAADKKPK